MKGYKNNIGVSGTHGKSTTTSMIAQIYIEAMRDPTVFCGAVIPSLGTAYRVGGEEHGDFIFEACEYTDSFLQFYPHIAVVLNVEEDHLDYFCDIYQIIDSFRRFMAITGKDGYAVVNADSPHALEAADEYHGTLYLYTADKANVKNHANIFTAENIVYTNGCGEFDVCHDKGIYAHITLGVPGEHNISNALAACVCAYINGIDGAVAAAALARFLGAKRRFEYKGKFEPDRSSGEKATVFDDYAHHPTEIATTLKAAKTMGYRQIWCVFQPHTYSRTASLKEDFISALKFADKVILAPIYSATEKDMGLVSSADLLRNPEHTVYIPTGFEDIAGYIRKNAAPGDLVITMGAGDIYKVGDYLGLV